MARSKAKKPKMKGVGPKVKTPPRKNTEVRNAVDTTSSNQRKISWQMGGFDWDGPWGKASFDGKDVSELITSHISSFESMSWNELPKKQHHSIETKVLNTCAQRRLEDIEQDDVDEIFSLRLQGKHRVYGIKDGSVLKVLWYDLEHGDNSNCVCRSVKKHT